MSPGDPPLMMAWTRPAGLIAAAFGAAWLRGFVDDERVIDALTLLAVACAVVAALFVLQLAAGRPSKRG